MPGLEGDSRMTPGVLVVIRPILLPTDSVNHRFPSGPAVMPKGVLSAVGMVKSLNRLTSVTP